MLLFAKTHFAREKNSAPTNQGSAIGQAIRKVLDEVRADEQARGLSWR